MAEYLFNDLYQTIRSRKAKIYLIGILLLILVANIAVIAFRFIYGSNEGTFSYNVFEYASWCFLIPYYSMIFLASAAMGREYIYPKKEGNVLEIPVSDQKPTKGKVVLKPAMIYLEKLILTILLAFIFMIVAFVLLYVITQLFHINEGIIQWMIAKLFLEKALLATPLWFAGISFAVMFMFIFEKKWKAYAAFIIITVIIPQLIRILSLDSFRIGPARFLRTYTITQNFGLIPYPSYPDRSVPLIVTIGIVYGLVATAVGMILYRKRCNNG